MVREWTRASLNDYLTTLAIQARNAVREYAEQAGFPDISGAITFCDGNVTANSNSVDGKYLFYVTEMNGRVERDVFGESKYWEGGKK